MSRCPQAAIVWSMARATSSSAVASPSTTRARPPAARTRPATASSRSRRRASSVTAHPRAPSASAVAAPMPADAPLTSATRSPQLPMPAHSLPSRTAIGQGIPDMRSRVHVVLAAAGVVLSVLSLVAAQRPAPAAGPIPGPSKPEPRLRNVKQLTFGGENAEAYFSPDGRQLVFQSTRDGVPCDQQFVMNVDGSGLRRVSSGEGRTTCGYFTPDGAHVVYASTFK